MAFPQVVSYNEEGIGQNTTHTLTYPSGVSNGDLLICVFATDGDNSVTNWNVTDNWTEIVSGNEPGGKDAFLAVAYRVADGNEGSTFQIVTSASEKAAYIIYRITGADVTTDLPEGTLTQGDSSSPNSPSHDTTQGDKDYLWISCMGADDDDAATAWPYADNNRGTTSADPGGCAVAACTDELTGDTQDPGAFTIPATEEWVAATIAVFPAPVGADINIDENDAVENVTVTDVETVSLPDALKIDKFDSVSVEDVEFITTVYNVSEFDSTSVTESVTVAPSLKIDVFDGVTVAEDVTRHIPVTISVYDTVPNIKQYGADEGYQISLLSDGSYGVITEEEFVANDTLAFGTSIGIDEYVSVEIITPDTDVHINTFDTVTVEESVTVSLPDALEVSVFDNVNVAEDIARYIPVAADIFDSVSVLETVAAKLSDHTINVNEEVTLTEQVTSSLPDALAPSVFSETTVTDVDFVEVDLNPSVYEEVTVQEFQDLDLSDLLIDTFDSVTVDEDITVRIDFNISVYDEVSVVDEETVVVGAAPDRNISVFDNVGVTDVETVEPLQLAGPSTADTADTTEYVEVTVSTPEIDTFDSVSADEYTDVLLVSLIDVFDEVTVQEYVEAALSDLGVDTFDEVTVTDVPTVQVVSPGDLSISVFDTVTVEEQIGLELSVLQVSVFDESTVTEQVAVSLVSFISVFDSTSVSEEETLVLSDLEASVFDNVDLTEQVTVEPDRVIDTGDLVTVDESVTVVIEGALIAISEFDVVSVADVETVEIEAVPALVVSVFDSISVGEYTDGIISAVILSTYDSVSVVDYPTVLWIIAEGYVTFEMESMVPDIEFESLTPDIEFEVRR